MTITHITPKEQALMRENERLTDQVKRQSATIHVQAVAIQSMQADADRYRWIVGNIVNDNLDAIENAFEVFGDAKSCTKEEFDAAIDAAMKETK